MKKNVIFPIKILAAIALIALLAGCSGAGLPKPQIQSGALQPQTVALNPADWAHDPPRSGDEIIWGITPGADGAMWFATNNGVWRFDGVSWRVFTVEDGLPSNSVTAIAAAPDGGLYAAACQGGLVRLQGERWVTVGDGMPEALAARCAWALLPEENSRVWLGIMNPRSGQSPGYGAVQYDGQTWKTYTPEKNDLGPSLPASVVDIGGQDVFKALRGAHGDLWFLTEAGLTRFFQGGWSSLSNQDLGSDERLYNLVTAPDGALWLGSARGALQFDGKNWTLYEMQGLSPVAAGADGAVWLASETDVLRFQGGVWSRFSVPEAFAKARILSAAVGPDGALWLGAIQAGIFRYLPGGAALPSR